MIRVKLKKKKFKWNFLKYIKIYYIVKNVTNYIKNIKIPFPSLEKQKKIVDYLDFNNNLINNFNKEIENNKKQGESFFNMFLSD